MRRFLKKFTRILGYTFVYILITIGTAVGILFLGNGGGDAGNGIKIAPQINNIYENFTTVKALKVNLDISVESPTDAINIGLDARLDMRDGFSELGAEGVLNINVNNEIIPINFSYVEGKLFVEVLNGKFVIETSNLSSSLSGIMKLLNVELPDLGGLDLSNLDVKSLLAMLTVSNEDKVNKDTIVLTITLPVIEETIQIVCDVKYNVKMISFPKTTISEGTTLELKSNIDYPGSVTIDQPTDPQYINATNLFSVANSLLNYLDNDQISLDIDVAYDEQDFSGNLTADLNNLSAKFETNFLDRPLDLIAQNNVIFLEYGNVNLKYGFDDIPLLSGLFDRFGIDVPIEKITSIISSLKNGNFLETISGIDLGTSSAGLPDLSIIESFERVDNTYTLIIRDIGQIKIGVNDDDSFASISFEGFGVNTTLSKATPSNIVLANSEESYINLAKLIPVAEAIVDTARSTEFAGKAVIDPNNSVKTDENEEVEGLTTTSEEDIKPITVDYQLSLKNGIRANLTTNLFGQDIVIDLFENNLYIGVSNLKLKANLDDVDSIIEFLKSVDIDVPSFTLEEIIKKVKEIVNPEFTPLLIKSLVEVDNGIQLTLFNNLTFTVNYTDILNGFNITLGNISANIDLAQMQEGVNIEPVTTSLYTPITHIINKANSVINYVKNTKYYLGFSFNYEKYNVEGFINVDESGLSLSASTTIDENTLQIQLTNKVIYVDINQFKLKFKIDELDKVFSFLKDNFKLDVAKMLGDINTKLGIDILALIGNPIEEVKSLINNNKSSVSSSLDMSTVLDLVKQLTLGYSDNVNEQSVLNLNISDISASLTFIDDNLKYISFSKTKEKISANLTINPSLVTVSPIGTYFNVTEIIPYIEMAIDLVNTKQFNLVVTNAKVFEASKQTYSVNDAVLQMDFQNGFNLYGKIDLKGKVNANVEVAVYDNYLFVNYQGLLLKINIEDLGELMVIALNMLGIDPNVLPFLKDVADGMGDLNYDNFTSIMPGIDFGNPLSMLKLLKSLNIENNNLHLSLDGKVITSNPNASNMDIILRSNGSKLTGLSIANMFTGAVKDEYFNLDIAFKDFTKVTAPDTNKNYIDISGANELIKAIINTAELGVYRIAGTLNINMQVIDIINIDSIKVPFDIKFKVVENKTVVNGEETITKNIELMGTVGVIPEIKGVNNDTELTNVVENRMAYLYYKDKYLYIYRTERGIPEGTSRSYQKKLKIHIDEVLNDPMFILQYISGLSDSIMEQIDKAMAMARNRTKPIDPSNIIEGFQLGYNDPENVTETTKPDFYTVKINLAEIANNPQVDSITVTLKTTQASIPVDEKSSVTKEILGSMTVNVHMPVAGAFILDLTSNDIALKDIGQDFDMSELYDYVDSYSYAENEQWEGYFGGYEGFLEWNPNKGEWYNTKTKNYTLTFVTNDPAQSVDNLTGTVDTPISLKQLNERVLENGGGLDYYKFTGWFTSEDCSPNSLFTKNAMPRRNYTLYAGWELYKQTRTVEFWQGETRIHTQIGEIGKPLDEIIPPTYTEVEGNVKSKYVFECWVDASGEEITSIPETSQRIYPKFRVEESWTKYNVTVISECDGVKILEPEGYIEGDTYERYFIQSFLPNYSTYTTHEDGLTTVYRFDGFFLDAQFSKEFDFFMPDYDIVVYAKWHIESQVQERNFIIIDNNEEIYNEWVEVGAAITLAQSVTVNGYTQWYLNADYSNPETKYSNLTTLPDFMPNSNVTLHIRNKYNLSYEYYVKENNVHTKKSYTDSLYQGESFPLASQTNYEITYYSGSNLSHMTAYRFAGYQYADGTAVTQGIMANHEMTFSSVCNTETQKYYTITFHTDWARPGVWVTDYDNSGLSGKPDFSQTAIAPMVVLAGSTINMTTLSKKTSILNNTFEQVSIVSKFNCYYGGLWAHYYFETDSWKTTPGCENKYNHSDVASNTETITITGNTDLYCIWKHV